MKTLIYINACMHEHSRTARIAAPLIEELSRRYRIREVRLDDSTYQAIDRDSFRKRMNMQVPDSVVNLSKEIAAADRMVIAAPFWDMSFPAALKVFFENMSLFNITFEQRGNSFSGLCHCERLLYITTRGMDLDTGDEFEQATPYIRAISRLWGLGPLQVVAARNMDFVSPQEIEEKIRKAVSEGLEICRTF